MVQPRPPSDIVLCIAAKAQPCSDARSADLCLETPALEHRNYLPESIAKRVQGPGSLQRQYWAQAQWKSTGDSSGAAIGIVANQGRVRLCCTCA